MAAVEVRVYLKFQFFYSDRFKKTTGHFENRMSCYITKVPQCSVSTVFRNHGRAIDIAM